MHRQSERRKGAEGVHFLYFYSNYPTRDNTDVTGIQSGYFEHIIKYCKVGFKSTQVIPDNVTKH